MAFGLQFLDGVGEAYNEPLHSTGDVENRQLYYGDEDYDTDNETEERSCRKNMRGCGSAVKLLVVFAVGMVAGQAVRKLFKD